MNVSTSPAVHATPRTFVGGGKSALGLPRVYLVLMVVAAVELFVVFSGSIAFRLANPGWKTVTYDGIYGDWQLDLHALTASLWMLLFFTQTGLGMAALRSVRWSARLHRMLGWALSTALAVVFAAFASRMSYLNPLGFELFTNANIVYFLLCVLVVLGVGVAAAMRGDIELHIDSQFIACMLLTAPSTIRLLKLFGLLLLGNDAVSEVENVFAVWAVVLSKTAVVLALRGRLWSNRVSVAVMLAGLSIAVLWALLILPAD